MRLATFTETMLLNNSFQIVKKHPVSVESRPWE